MKGKYRLLFVLLCAMSFSCKQVEKLTLSELDRKDFQTEVDGALTDLYVLKNKKGMEVCVTNYGARVVSIMVPDRDGKMEDVVLGFSSIKEYMDVKQNFGATIGRYVGRIRNAAFTIDSVAWKLESNAGGHMMHGGDPGFAARIWQAEQLDLSSVKLSYLSPDGENGFPGNLNVHLIYRVTEDNSLDITYEATTDAPTVVNLTHHSFFNLSGALNTSVEGQVLYVNADYYTPLDTAKFVTGEILPVEGTPMDFTTPHRIGERIDADFMQLNLTKGYDHNWVLKTGGDVAQLAAYVLDEKSGRKMEVYTDEPGLQVYTANNLKGKTVGKKGVEYLFRNAICLETQHFQNSPNMPHFPSTTLRPGERYKSHCIYRFTTVKE